MAGLRQPRPGHPAIQARTFIIHDQTETWIDDVDLTRAEYALYSRFTIA